MTQPHLSRDDIEQLLPFHVNGTLDKDEQALVDQALDEDEDLRAEAVALSNMRDTWTEMSDDLAEGSPGEAGLDRLMAEVNAQTASQSFTGNVPPAANTNAPLLRRIAGLAAAAAFGAALATTLMQGPTQPIGAEMASGGSTTLSDAPALTVEFRGTVAIEDVSDTLRSLDFIVIDGPSAIGLFRLAHLDGRALTLADAENLRAREDIFLVVDDPE